MYRGRFAPSPTGTLHFGSLIAALASYCDARASGGGWLVRIEDVDEPRSRDHAAMAILATLEAYGFEWDGEVVRQSHRSALYQEAVERLVGHEEAFACTCTRREIEAGRLGAGGERVYPGTCRSGAASGREAKAWRLRVTDEALPTPLYLHHPVAILASGEKLSKQTGAAPLPIDPLPALLQVWSFLGQRELPARPASLAEFWSWAHRMWTPADLPPVTMLPSPR